MQKPTKILSFIRRQPRWRLVATAIAVAGAAFLWFRTGTASAGNSPTFAARRGPLDIKVPESGSLQALESQEVKCEVRGFQGTKILKLVEEGYFVTEEDVKTNKVLCELDSSELQKQIVEKEIAYQSAAANLTDAEQNFQIQLGQNQSDIGAAEQKARFARMDFDKLLGASITDQVVQAAGLDKLLAAVSTNYIEELPRLDTPPANTSPARTPPDASAGNPADVKALVDARQPTVQTAGMTLPAAGGRETALAAASKPPASTPASNDPPATTQLPRITAVDFTQYANVDLLGDGESKQKLRKFQDDLQMAEKELGQATNNLEGTRRLFIKGFVAQNDVTKDEIACDNARLKMQTSVTAQALFLQYEFPKSGEEALSKYAEAVRELDKARHVAIAKLAQAKARLNSARGQYQVQLRQRTDLQDQLEKCVMRAQKSGLVVYGVEREWGDPEPIREGASVRERQTIITIPDMTRMGVKVRIHEGSIKKIKKGQKVRINVDAFPDQVLTGEVSKVGVLPDSQNRWLNPDLKVYLTTITINETNNWVKPGMSAKVDIFINHLEDVVYVPMQTVVPDNGKQICYVMNGSGTERREVTIGEFTSEFIEIKNGIKEGDRVLLRPPGAVEAPADNLDQKPPEKGKDSSPGTPAPAPVATKTAKAG